MSLSDLTLITHTHSDCSDIWIPYFDSYNLFFNHKNHIVLNNEKSNIINLNQYIYNKILFSDRILNILYELDTKYILISLEDMILYDYVNNEKIKQIIDFCDTNNVDFFRLIKSGIRSNTYFCNNFYKIENYDWLFSVTPTIWNRYFLIKILENNKNLNIWNLEINANFFLKSQNINSFYYFDNEDKVGGHYNSSIYPHICSAINKGKWNLSEYPIIKEIAKKYNINLNERGTV